MNKAVADSTVLIYLAKLDQLELLEQTYDTVLIPEEVFREVVEQGKELGEKDAVRVENEISKNLIELKNIEVEENIEKFEMEAGEKEVLSLANKQNIDEVLIDESSVREIAETFDLKPRGTLYFLLKTVRDNKKSLGEFLELMEDLSEAGFHLNEKVYVKAVREAQKLAEE